MVDAERNDIFRSHGLWWLHIEGKETTENADLKPRDVWPPDPLFIRLECHMDRSTS